jgi:hypothetical protein
MRRAVIPHPRRRTFLVLGLVTACVAATATTVPAYAGPAYPGPAYAGPTHAGPAARSAAPSPNAPISGHPVAGAVYGSAARRAAGSAAATFLKLHRNMLAAQRGHSRVSPHTVLHAWWGSFPDTNSGPGVMATQSVSSTFRLSHSGDILYAPTMTAANNSCIEVVTMHNKTQAQVWAWDWCVAIAPGAEVNVDASFVSTYTTTVNGLTSYTTRDVQTNAATNTWTAYLYNYQTKAWDTLFSQSGTDQSGLTYGWDMFEFYSTVNPSTNATYVCANLRKSGLKLESSSLAIYSGGVWNPATPSNTTWNPEAHPNPASYNCPTMKFNIITNNSAWMVDVAKT